MKNMSSIFTTADFQIFLMLFSKSSKPLYLKNDRLLPEVNREGQVKLH
jgi:hypothetical protein